MNKQLIAKELIKIAKCLIAIVPASPTKITKDGHMNLTMENCTWIDLPAWFKKASTENAKVRIDARGKSYSLLIWDDGTWLGGDWENNGVWRDGIWKGGKFKNGIWETGAKGWEGGEICEGAKCVESSKPPITRQVTLPPMRKKIERLYETGNPRKTPVKKDDGLNTIVKEVGEWTGRGWGN